MFRGVWARPAFVHKQVSELSEILVKILEKMPSSKFQNQQDEN